MKATEEVDVELLNIRSQQKELEEAGEEQRLAWCEWDRMRSYLEEECDSITNDPRIKALQPAPTLRVEHMRPRWSRITYLRGRDRHVMHLCYSIPLRCCTFEMHCKKPVSVQYLLVRNGEAYFQKYMPGRKEKHKTEHREEVARRILRVLLAEAQWIWPPYC